MVEPSFQGVNRLFVLAFGNDTQRTSHSGYYLPNIEIKKYNVIINGEKLFSKIGVPIGVTSASLSLAFSLCTGLVKNYQKQQEIRKRSIIKLSC